MTLPLLPLLSLPVVVSRSQSSFYALQVLELENRSVTVNHGQLAIAASRLSRGLCSAFLIFLKKAVWVLGLGLRALDIGFRRV